MNIASLVVRAFPADFPEIVEGLKVRVEAARAVRRRQHRHHRGRRGLVGDRLDPGGEPCCPRCRG